MSELPEPATVVAERKRQLRARLLAGRERLATGPLDARLLAGVARLVRGVASVAGYAPLRAEPGGAELPATLAAQVARVLLPVLRPDNDLDWAEYDGPLPPGRGPAGRGLREPAGTRLGLAAIGTVDLVLVPALAVDRRTGTRLGRGGGSYDRALARRRPGTTTVALLYPGELLDDLPADPHDQRVDAVLTPDGLIFL